MSRRAVPAARHNGAGGAPAFPRIRWPRTFIGSALLAAGLLAASPGAPGIAGAVPAAAQEPQAEQCLDPQVCPIPYVRLSKQETKPFLFLGMVVDEDHPRYRHYGSAIRRFPDVKSCLVAHERDKRQPDLRQVDWGAVRDTRDLDVCVFRIASSIENTDRIRAWLQYQGFKVGEITRIFGERHSASFENEPMFGLEAHLSRDRFREILPRSWFERLIGFEGLRNLALVVSFSPNWQVVGVASVGNSIFN